jgi:hypothetical protein
VLQKTIETYKIWHLFHQGFPRLSKHTLGEKIDGLLTDIIELILSAGYAHSDKKLPFVSQAVGKVDVLKSFVQIAWELKCLDHKQFAAFSTPLHGIGKDLGAWRKDLQRKSPSV